MQSRQGSHAQHGLGRPRLWDAHSLEKDHRTTSCGNHGAFCMSWPLSLLEAVAVFLVLSRQSFGLWCSDYPQSITQLCLILMLRENQPQAERQSSCHCSTEVNTDQTWTNELDCVPIKFNLQKQEGSWIFTWGPEFIDPYKIKGGN